MKKIIYVEDDAINAFVLVKLLEKDFDVCHLTDGESCLKQLESNPVDLVLMDINLGAGKMDGAETFRKIRMSNKEIPVIAVTAYAMPEDKDYFLKMGFNAYVPKPIEKEALIRMIRKFL